MSHFYGGVDVGSTCGKAVILKRDEVVASAIVRNEIDPEDTARMALNVAISQVRHLGGVDGLKYLVATGYGRNHIPFADENISEITCHALGVHSCDPGIRTIVDIGGQDVKSIAVAEDGAVWEFVINDKCAAGTGSFFEAMARVFHMDLAEFSRLSLTAPRAVPITAPCSVFAETEVMSHLARGKDPAEVARGIELYVARRCFVMLKRVGIKPGLAVTGGCRKNQGLIKELVRILGMEIASLPVDPQLMGALGAARMARRKATRIPAMKPFSGRAEHDQLKNTGG